MLIVKIFLLFLIIIPTFLTKDIFARTTPDDIAREKMNAYETKVKNYSLQNQQNLKELSASIAKINADRTGNLERITELQGLILDEYVRRNNIDENGGEDGIHRSQDPVSVARIEITRAHEAVAYQAAKVYIFNLTSEINIKTDANNLISSFQADLESARSRVIKSQNILMKLIK